MGGWTGEHVGWWAGNLKAGGQARCHFCLSNGNDRPLTEFLHLLILGLCYLYVTTLLCG